jgi:flagellar hook assembly protein FlgD/sugar lactone lactonase YvrE
MAVFVERHSSSDFSPRQKTSRFEMTEYENQPGESNMKTQQTLRYLMAGLFVFAALGFYSFEKSGPEDLGFYRAQIDDRGLVELAVDQIREAIKTGNTGRLQSILADDFAETVSVNHRLLKGGSLDAVGSSPANQMRLNPTDVAIADDRAVVQAAISTPSKINSTAELVFEKKNQQWKLVEARGLFSDFGNQTLANQNRGEETGFKLFSESAVAEKTLIRQPVSAEHNIDRLTQSVTKGKLDRQLFEKPYSAVLFSSVTQLNHAPFFAARYVQVVSDPAWNRLVYGDYEGWIKAYPDETHLKDESHLKLNSPHGVDRDSDGNIYVADTGNNRIVVLRLVGSGEDTELKFQFAFGAGELIHPYDVAWDDAGTPLDANDDRVWVTDTGNGRVLGYKLTGADASVHFIFGDVGSDDGAFFEPKAVAVGRFNGAADGTIFVADTGNRRLVKLNVLDNRLEWLTTFTGKEESQFTSIDVDHWGNVFAADHSYREITKLTSNLEPLAAIKNDGDSLLDPVNLHVTFGKVFVEAENRSYWAGYDQAFVVEKWSETSGGERYQLGLDLANFEVELSAALDEIDVRSRLTDHGDVSLTVIDAKSNAGVRQAQLGWMIPGEKSFAWDRRDDSGLQVAPGYYRLQMTAKSSYGNFKATKETQPFYLPLYYWDDSGADVHHDAHLIQGTRSTEWGAEPQLSVAKHPSEVGYRFTDLNPSLDYELTAQFTHPAGEYVKQRIVADGVVIHEDFEVDSEIKTVDWLQLPKELFADGVVDVRIVKTGGSGDAVISQIGLREANFDPANPPVLNDDRSQLPQEFTLQQNYPNPFNPNTTIEFGIPNSPLEGTPAFNSPLEGGLRGVLVTLRIFNVRGQIVRELVNAALPPGRHSVVWNGQDDFGRPAASGIYFYQLRAGNNVQQVRKLTLMK